MTGKMDGKRKIKPTHPLIIIIIIIFTFSRRTD